MITDLTPTELPLEAALALYFLRWGIETHHDDLKYQCERENFSGKSPLVIQQDFHATLLMSNLVAVAEHEVQAEIPTRLALRDHKYAEYRINRNMLVGKMKDRLIAILLEDNDRQPEAVWNRLRREVERNLLPIRQGRTAPRDKSAKANKYAPNRRRLFLASNRKLEIGTLYPRTATLWRISMSLLWRPFARGSRPP